MLYTAAWNCACAVLSAAIGLLRLSRNRNIAQHHGWVCKLEANLAAEIKEVVWPNW
jgi:hypothetical protein